jgi:hypothetical protein
MIKKCLLIICIIKIIGLIQSCCEENMNCFWKDFSIENIDNSNINPLITNQIQIRKKAYGIRVNMMDSLLYYANLNLVQNVNATSCGQNYIVNKKINKIQIIVLNKNYSQIDSIDVSKNFKARKSSETNTKYITIQAIIDYLNSADTFNDNSYRLISSSFDLYLMDTINIQDTCRFKLNLQFYDNSVLSHETSELVLY